MRAHSRQHERGVACAAFQRVAVAKGRHSSLPGSHSSAVWSRKAFPLSWSFQRAAVHSREPQSRDREGARASQLRERTHCARAQPTMLHGPTRSARLRHPPRRPPRRRSAAGAGPLSPLPSHPPTAALPPRPPSPAAPTPASGRGAGAEGRVGGGREGRPRTRPARGPAPRSPLRSAASAATTVAQATAVLGGGYMYMVVAVAASGARNDRRRQTGSPGQRTRRTATAVATGARMGRWV
jgi:hypothetical protein